MSCPSHALPKGKELYLCNRETNAKIPKAAGLEISFITDYLKDARSEQTIIILDCCYAGRSVKSSARLDLSFAQNFYCVAGSGAYDVTPDSKSKGQPSPFTEELARLLLDDKIAADDRGAVTVDEIWKKLEKFETAPVRSAGGAGSLILARRGELRAENEQGLDPLQWLPAKSTTVHCIDLEITSQGIYSKWPGASRHGNRLDEPLVSVMSRMLELIDGVGHLSVGDQGDHEQWEEVMLNAWRGMGETLFNYALPRELREYIGTKIRGLANDELVKIRIRFEDEGHARCPWEALRSVELARFLR